MDAGFAAFRAQSRFGSLDGLRCLAVVAVIWHHAAGPRDGALGMGFLGVDLFFAISGFLITTLLVRERRLTGRIDLRRFYVRRSLRIFPLYFAVLALYALIVVATRRGTAEGEAFLGNLPAFATYTSNWFVSETAGEGTTFYFAWSLATEEQFYLVWAPVLLLCLAYGRARWAAAVVLALVAVDQVASRAGGDALALHVLRSVATPICLGALWALVLDSAAGFRAAGRVLAHPAAAPVVALAVVAALAATAPVELVQVLLAALVAVCCVREDHALAPFLRLRPIAFAGVVSYGMYLTHMLAVNVVRPAVGQEHGLKVFAAALALTVALAAASHRFFERPILRYKARFSVTPAAPPLVTAAPEREVAIAPPGLTTSAHRAAA